MYDCLWQHVHICLCECAVCFLLLITTQRCGYWIWAWLCQEGEARRMVMLVGPVRSTEIKVTGKGLGQLSNGMVERYRSFNTTVLVSS